MARPFLLYIQLRRLIKMLRHILPILFPLFYALGQQVFYLPVYRTEIVLGPRGNGFVQLGRQP